MLSKEISPNDRLFRANPKGYARAGAVAVEHIRNALNHDPESVLDLPCGHGRVLHALKEAFPSARLYACDLDRDGVDFCAAQFGATPIYSAMSALDVSLPTVELIWSGSFFTHLPLNAYRDFLALMARSLTPDGLVVFTTYSKTTLEHSGLGPDQCETIRADFDADGFGFQAYRGDGYQGWGTWGFTLSDRSRVEKEAADAGLEVVRHTEATWTQQDVVVCRPCS